MRQMISGLLTAAALTVAGAAPAMACGYGGCGQPYGYDHVGWGFERLPDPALQYHSVEHTPQYYYVNQGPTYTGPGAFAPYPTYREDAVVNYGARPYGYGPRYGYLPRVHYGYGPRYGYAHRPAPYHYGPRPLRRYY